MLYTMQKLLYITFSAIGKSIECNRTLSTKIITWYFYEPNKVNNAKMQFTIRIAHSIRKCNIHNFG